MKKTKKLLALALALMLSLSCMAMPAMAMENEARSWMCTVCKVSTSLTPGKPEIIRTTRTVGGCWNTNMTHTHTYNTQSTDYFCANKKCNVLVQTRTITLDDICNFRG